MKAPILVSCLAASLLFGCSDNSNKPATSTNAPGNSVDSAPADYVNGLARGQNLAVKTVDVASLNQAVQMYNVQEGHFPKDLNELVEGKFIGKIPDAPRGMKLDYDPATGKVSVVNAQ